MLPPLCVKTPVLLVLSTGLDSWPLGCGAFFGAGVCFGPGFASVSGLVFFEADVVGIEDEALDARPVARERGSRFGEVGPVIAVGGEIAASAG